MSGGLEALFSVDRGDFTLEIGLEVGPGETVALLGPNGAGKSTVAATLAGLIRISTGQIILGDRVLDNPDTDAFIPPESREVGVVFQDFLLFEHMTVAQNLEFGLLDRGLDKATRAGIVEDWLNRFQLEDLASRRARELSGGQSQRVALARTLVTKPALLILDEPTASLDASARLEIRHRLADDLEGFAGPRLLITHDPAEAFLFADSVCIIEEGVVTQSGMADDLRLRPRTRYVADLVGTNLVLGRAAGGEVVVEGFTIHSADTSTSGDVVAAIHPRAIAVYRDLPAGSPRNTWRTTIDRIEHYGDRVRLRSGDPIRLTVELTPGSADELALDVGQQIWLSIKATEIEVQPA